MQKIKKIQDLTVLNSPEETDYFVGYDVDQVDPDKATVLIPVSKGRNVIVDNITTLEALTGTVDGQVVQVKGYYAGEPLEMPDYIVDVDSVETPNGGSIIARAEGGNYIWKEVLQLTIKQFGAKGDGSTNNNPFIENTINYAISKGLTRVVVPEGDFAFTGGLSFEPTKDLYITGIEEQYNNCILRHTGDNTGITLTRASGGSLFLRRRINNLRVIGNAGSSARFAEFRDTWGSGSTTILVTGYSDGCVFVFHNFYQWTENPVLENIMSRANKYMVSLERTAASGGTDSFFGMKVKNCWHQFAVGNSNAFRLGDKETVKLYGADISIGGWFEVGGGHRFVTVANSSEFVDSKIDFFADGFGGLTDGSDLFLLNCSADSRIDVTGNVRSQQGGAIELTALSSGSTTNALRHIVKQNSDFDWNTTYVSPNVRFKGGGLRFLATDVSADSNWIIGALPLFSTWKARLNVNGSNFEFSQEYIISVARQNFLARVANATLQPTSTSDNINSNFKLSATDGGNGGNFSLNGGGKILLTINAATFGGTYDASLELEML